MAANPHKGEVEIDLRKSVSKNLLQPRDRKTVYLKFSMEAVGNIERDIRREVGGDISVFEILMRLRKFPWKISILETAVMLQHGLADQFPSMSLELAYRILDIQELGVLLSTILEALNVSFEGAMPEAVQKELDQEPFIETVEEGEGKK
jgi:hypothetical protein